MNGVWFGNHNGFWLFLLSKEVKSEKMNEVVES